MKLKDLIPSGIGAVVGGLVAGPVGAAVGGLSGLSYSSTRRANRLQQYQYENTLNFEREMSNTAHQREVADLRLAGLNPILSATGGSGASTPSVSAGALHTFSDDGSALVNARQQNAMLAAQYRNINADSALKEANAYTMMQRLPYEQQLNSAQAYNQVMNADVNKLQLALNDVNSEVQRELYRQQALHSAAQTRNQSLQNDVFSFQVPSLQEKAANDSQFYRSGTGRFVYGLGKAVNTATGGALNALFGNAN